ncbi:MAG: hypothetical protein WCK13_01500 [Ignavibacteriota bacterium]
MSKKFITHIFLILLFSPILLFAQQEVYYNDFIKGANYIPRQDYDAFNQDGSTKNRSSEVVVVYLDFPDGRVPGTNSKIPETYEELQAIKNYYGNYDAVGELGQINTTTPIKISQNYYAKLFKYSYANRWNMFFSENKFYKADKHPDYETHRYTTNPDLSFEAYGSLRDYWKEVSANNFNIYPAETHPNETEDMYRTGIVNKIITINGVKCIQSIMLPKNKYGTSWSNSYFKNYDTMHSDQNSDTFFIDARTATINAYINGEIDFDVRRYSGLIIYVFAGGHNQIKGYADIPTKSSFVRGMYDNIISDNGVIDGISCIAHEVAHAEFHWAHAVGGTNCLMNPRQTKDVNCPSHPNPIFKLMEGWVTPIHLNQNITGNNFVNLQPVETSSQVGIITIYGNPAGAPDHLSGECYVVENRRRLGFDEKIENDILLNSTFKGGLLIWHFSPYKDFPSTGVGQDERIKLIVPDENVSLESVEGSFGDPEFYFAYDNDLQNPIFYDFLQNRSYSQEGLKTGINVSNISQINDLDVNSNMKFQLNYAISTPPQYNHTIIDFRGGTVGNKITHLTGRTFFHKENTFEYFRVYPGSRIDMAPGSSMNFAGIKAIGDENNKIIFASTGYENQYESYFCNYMGMLNATFSTLDEVDGAVFKNVHFENVEDARNIINIKYLLNPPIPVPVEIENITTDYPNQTNPEIILNNCLINKLYINGLYTILYKISTTPQASINLTDANIKMAQPCIFGINANVVFSNCNLTNDPTLILKPYDGSIWQGIKLEGGGINFNGVTIKGATKGLNLNGLTNDLKISNCTFDNLNQDLTINGYVFNNITDNGRVYGNTFYPNGNNAPIHIWVLNTNTISIENNDMSHTKWTGIALFNCNIPTVKIIQFMAEMPLRKLELSVILPAVLITVIQSLIAMKV